MMRCEAMMTFQGVNEWVPTTKGHQIDTMFFHGNKIIAEKWSREHNNETRAVLFSNPNAGIYEHSCISNGKY